MHVVCLQEQPDSIPSDDIALGGEVECRKQAEVVGAEVGEAALVGRELAEIPAKVTPTHNLSYISDTIALTLQ